MIRYDNYIHIDEYKKLKVNDKLQMKACKNIKFIITDIKKDLLDVYVEMLEITKWKKEKVTWYYENASRELEKEQ